ncbi:hypothetical protein OCU04_003492 [Sclerotinia nivalis]|uniref:Uncharacterized protein n=1 Tax=Sclerotinia nivalis TaxID=352851 RepID=A0A9X0DN93_9HELO|nr:hypothetical protein OCU04_003492 [Sclerotinia nivalis]
MPKNQPTYSGNSVPYRELGEPEGPSWEVWREGRVLVVSLVFCGAAVIAVSLPRAAFWLGSRGNLQLIIVGLAISLINYCFEIEARALILVVEARFGRSTLQNFESVLYNSLFIKHAHKYMQLVMLLLSAFPLILSVAYKAFNDGETYTGDSGWLLNGQSILRYNYNNTYRLSNPLLDNRTTAIMIYATEPAVTLDTTYPLQLGSYGLNMQVFNHNTTAMLDPPTRDYLQSLRNNMRPGQTVYLRASVNAIFSSVNCTNADNSCRRPVGFLDSTSPSHAAWVSTVNVAGAGNIKFTMAANKAQQEVLFISAWDESADPPTNISSELIGFNLYRGHCDGRWRVNKTTVLLEEASECLLSNFSTHNG